MKGEMRKDERDSEREKAQDRHTHRERGLV